MVPEAVVPVLEIAEPTFIPESEHRKGEVDLVAIHHLEEPVPRDQYRAELWVRYRPAGLGPSDSDPLKG